MENTISAKIPTKQGDFIFNTWKGERGQELIVISTESINPREWVTVRVHSECITGDLFGCLRCDCGDQKDAALKTIQESQNGLLIYHRQEGRNYGLFDKMRVYKHDDENNEGFVGAWKDLGMTDDPRTYEDISRVVAHFKLQKVKLLTNNENKLKPFSECNVETEMVPLIVEMNKHNEKYFDDKMNLSEYKR